MICPGCRAEAEQCNKCKTFVCPDCGNTWGYNGKDAALIIKAPSKTDDAWTTLSKSINRMTPSTRKYVAEKLQKILDEEAAD